MGRFILCDIKAEEKLLTLANLYAPNMDDPIFFNKVFNHLKDFKCEEIILGGDFNLVLNVEKEKKGGLLRTHQKALAVVNQACEEFNLTDIWRILNPESQRYTWRRRKPEIQCRLDFFLISSSLICDTNLADIAPGYKTDHSIILLEIALHQNPRGRGFWKLNSSLLTDEQYLESIKTAILQTKTEYMSDNSVNPALLWEMIKMNVREKSISYAIAKTSKTKSREDALYKGIADLEREIDEADGTKGESQIPQLNTKLDNLNCELEKIIEYRTKGAIMRSRIRWHNEGEKNTKFFLSLEKRHYKQGTISRLKKNENEDKPIFYKNWYQSGISRVNQFIKVEPNLFFSRTEFEHMHNINVCPLAFCGIISTLKALWRNQTRHLTCNAEEQAIFVTDILKSKKPNKLAYQKFLQYKSTSSIPSQKKWSNLIQEYHDINWNNAYRLALKCTNSTKLIEFHFRFLHRVLATNTVLEKMGFRNDNKCTFCGKDPEKILHLFWYCNKTQVFWDHLTSFLHQHNILPQNCALSKLNALGLRPDSSKTTE